VDATRGIWEQLRQASSVDIVDITLRGSATRRAVDFAVTVDGTADATLGVLSQGEINSLALSLFLPRATSAESPLRFVVIDDPVQAMDPAKVDGLARVLLDAATDRQVIVFTHDDRLPAALRHLDLPARIVEVIRRSDSEVEVHPNLDPASRLLRDAGGLAAGDGVVPVVAARAGANLCRLAIEETALDIIRRRRLGRGDPHTDVEAVINANPKLRPRLALAISDDPAAAGRVPQWLETHLGRWAPELVRQVNEGSHNGTAGDLGELVGGTRRLVAAMRERLA